MLNVNHVGLLLRLRQEGAMGRGMNASTVSRRNSDSTLVTANEQVILGSKKRLGLDWKFLFFIISNENERGGFISNYNIFVLEWIHYGRHQKFLTWTFDKS